MNNTPMTPEAFAERMRELGKNWDKEESHEDGDDLMCEVLRSLGYGEGVEVFERMDKWCA